MIVDFGLRALRKKRDSNTTYNTPRQDKPLLMFNVSHDEEKPAQSSMMRADCDEQVFVRCVQIRGGGLSLLRLRGSYERASSYNGQYGVE